MSNDYNKLIDKLIQKENQRRWWTEDPSKYKSVSIDEIPHLIENERLRQLYNDKKR